jgi:hypothetical protein
LSKISGQKIAVDFMSISFLRHEITADKIAIGNEIVINKILVTLSPFISSSENPFAYKGRIKISEIELNVDDKSLPRDNFISGGRLSEILFAARDFKLSIEKISIKANDNVYRISSIDFYSSYNTAGVLGVYEYQKDRAEFSLEFLPKEKNILNVVLRVKAGNKAPWFVYADGIFNLDNFDFNQNVSIEKTSDRDFQTSDLIGKAVKENGKLNVNLKGSLGKVDIVSGNLKRFDFKGLIDFSKINKNIDSKLKINSVYNNINSYKVRLETDNFSLYGLNFGNFSVDISKSGEGLYDIIYNYGQNRQALIKRFPDSLIEFQILLNKKTAGSGWINTDKGEADINVPGIAVRDIPFSPFNGDNPTGRASFAGTIAGESGGRIDFKILNFKTTKIANLDIFGILEKKDEIYRLNFYSADNSIFLNLLKDKDGLSFADLRFSKSKIDRILAIFGISIDITGIAKGAIVYERDVHLDIAIDIADGIFYGNPYKELSLKSQMTANFINIDNFTLTDDKGEIIAKINAALDFSKPNTNSYIDFELNNFTIEGIKVSALLAFRGQFVGDKINGIISGDFIKAEDLTFNGVSAKATVSKNEVFISKFKTQNGLSGELWYQFNQAVISADAQFKNSDFSNVVKDLKAVVNMKFNISGKIENPQIECDILLKDANYRGIPFSLKSRYAQKDGAAYIEGGNILVGKDGKISFGGEYSRFNEVKILFENIPLDILEKMDILENLELKGFISGNGIVRNNNGFAQANIFFNGKNMSLLGIKLDEFKSNARIQRKSISINDAFVKIADTEIQNINGFYENRTYKLDMKLVNAHLSYFDVFGNIALSGKITDDGKETVYSGQLDLDDFWINRTRLSNYKTEYEIKDKTFLLSHKGRIGKDGDLSLEFDFKNKPTIKSFEITDKVSAFRADAVFDKNDFVLNVDGENINIDFLSAIFNLDIESEGKVNFLLKSSGSLANPDIKFLLSSINGSIMSIPYDYANIEFEVSQNRAVIKNARVYKSNMLDLAVSGDFPFWLDPAVKSKISERNINIIYGMRNSNLHILEYLTEGFVKAKSGSFAIEGNVSGIIDNIENSGKLVVNNGAIDMEDIFGRIKNMEVDIEWNGNQIKVNEFVGKSGSGQINITGGGYINSSDVYGNFTLEDLDIRVFTTGKGVPVRISELPISGGLLNDASRGNPTFDITILGSLENPKVSGVIVLENTHFNYVEQDADPSSFLNSIDYNVDIMSGKNTNFENTNMLLLLNGKVNIKGKYPNIMTNGSAESYSGFIRYLGVSFEIVDAKIEIIDNVVFVSGEANTVVLDKKTGAEETMRVGVERSSIEDLILKFSSKDDPTLDSRVVYSRILGVGTGSENGDDYVNKNTSDLALRQKAFRFFNENATMPFTQTILRKVGIVDSLKISYVNTDVQKKQAATNTSAENGEVPSGNSEPISLTSLLYGTKYSFEKNITNQMTFGYSIIFDQINRNNADSSVRNNDELALRHEIEMKYRLTNNLFIDATYELLPENSIFEPDRRIMLQQQIRFGGRK